MTHPPTFEEAFERSQQIRKRGGTPPALLADLEAAQRAFETAIVASVGAADPAAAQDAAVREVVSQIIAKVMADVTASGRSPAVAKRRAEDHAMDPTDYITKGGTAWQAIETAAAQRVSKRLGTMTPVEKAQAIDAFLATEAGAALYAAYVAEQEGVVTKHRRSRLDPPPTPAPAVQKMAASAAWGLIESAARKLAEQSGGTLSQAAAVDQFLRTAEGKKLYQRYLAEERAAQSRR
jgi:hypothetical protein